jgi:hypothetical protein
MNNLNKQVLPLDNLNYPSAIEWMWDYCTYLGDYVDKYGEHWDLGILIRPQGHFQGHSNASVYGDTPGNYKSGEFSMFDGEVYAEVEKRAKAHGIW